MKNLKFFLMLGVLLCLSIFGKAQCITIDIETKTKQTQVCADIQLNFNPTLADKLIISDGEGREDTFHTNQSTLKWCYERQPNDQQKYIEVYVVKSGEVRPVASTCSSQSNRIVIIDGM